MAPQYSILGYDFLFFKSFFLGDPVDVALKDVGVVDIVDVLKAKIMIAVEIIIRNHYSSGLKWLR